MDFEEFLKIQAQLINLRLKAVVSEIYEEGIKVSDSLKANFEKFGEASEQGKRIRGSLVLLGYKIGKGRDFKKVVDAAVAFEIFQTAILAQDDVIDKSLIRRGKSSLYQALGGDNKAISQTICLSDIGFFKAYRLLSNLEIEDLLKIKAINLFSQTLTQTVLGEMLDIEIPSLKKDFLEEDSLKIGLLKTARYTVSGPLMMGAILAGANVELLKKLQIFGDNLGIAFQIQDDVLGVFGEEKVTGKSTSSDIKEGKATVLIAYAQKKGNKEEKGILEKYYGNEEIDKGGVEQVRNVFKQSGALEYANLLADKYFEKAQESLKDIEEGLLYSLVKFVRKRDR